MRVTGSQFMSTSVRFPDLVLVCSSVATGMVPVLSVVIRVFVAGVQLLALVTPLGFLVGAGIGDRAQRADHMTVGAHRCAREPRARRLVHERHELVRKAGHGAGDA